MAEMVHEGVVKWFSGRLGYGFILNSDGQEVMVHYNNIPGKVGFRNLEAGDRVKYYQEATETGHKVSQVLEFTRSL